MERFWNLKCLSFLFSWYTDIIFLIASKWGFELELPRFAFNLFYIYEDQIKEI